MRTIEDIAAGLGDGLEPWLGHDEACQCVHGATVTGHTLSLFVSGAHRPMCGGCSCGLRDALMAEAVETATDEEVLAYVTANGEDVDAIAAHVRETLRTAWQGFKERHP